MPTAMEPRKKTKKHGKFHGLVLFLPKFSTYTCLVTYRTFRELLNETWNETRFPRVQKGLDNETAFLKILKNIKKTRTMPLSLLCTARSYQL